MNPKSLILMLAAVLGVLAVIFLTRSYLTGVRQEVRHVEATKAVAPSAQVLVAKKNLPAGTILKADDMVWAPWPEDALNAAYFVSSKDKIKELTGRVLRASVHAQSPFNRAMMASPGDRGFLAAALSPGMRAVAVKVSAETSIGGFLFTGDRVDVILTHVVGMDRRAKAPVSETVFQNVRVLAIDQHTTDDASPAKVGKTVTLEVTPKMAEKMSMMEKVGTLSLSLRSLAHNTAGEDIDAISPPIDRTTSVTLGSDISKYLPSPDGAGQTHKSDSVVVHRGSGVQEVDLNEKTSARGGQ
ncbi:Flp pilus assembly protein CpaB [Kordiimonas marina]|uniref:Flp pilus assembly protein CpaB n=1 Tax=Kordiimonas marina TaxID=2872312 RepID=UPI001FF682AB|nr:Flp pilus assembly protein CpaB [Kordiimonas marina]MCJ9428588.1 Flp pilus assembly protein CpaB [Kordiimonas marina]